MASAKSLSHRHLLKGFRKCNVEVENRDGWMKVHCMHVILRRENKKILGCGVQSGSEEAMGKNSNRKASLSYSESLQHQTTDNLLTITDKNCKDPAFLRSGNFCHQQFFTGFLLCPPPDTILLSSTFPTAVISNLLFSTLGPLGATEELSLLLIKLWSWV